MKIYYYSEGQCACHQCRGEDFDSIDDPDYPGYVRCTQCGTTSTRAGLFKHLWESDFSSQSLLPELKRLKEWEHDAYRGHDDGVGLASDPTTELVHKDDPMKEHITECPRMRFQYRVLKSQVYQIYAAVFGGAKAEEFFKDVVYLPLIANTIIERIAKGMNYVADKEKERTEKQMEQRRSHE